MADKCALGVYVEHRYRKSNWLYLVSVWKKPFIRNGEHVSKFCPLCQTLHFTKTVHLDLVAGRAIVSEGVLEELKLAGLPDLDITGTTKNPPALKVGRAPSRIEQNQNHRKIKIWKRYTPKGVPANGLA